MAINRGAGTQTVPVRRTDARRGGEGARDMAAATETRRHANAMQPAGPRERDSGQVNNPTAVASRTRPPLPPCGRAPRHVRDGMHPPRPPVLRARANGTDGSPAAAAAAFGTVSGASAQWQTGRHRPVAGWSCWSGPRRRVGLPRWDRWPY
jgi:hypothetical protein